MPEAELYDFRIDEEAQESTDQDLFDLLSSAAARAALVLTSTVRRSVSGQLLSLRIATAEELRANGCTIYAIERDLDAPPLGALLIDRRSLSGLADLLVGGPGAGADRVPSEFEQSLVRRQLEALLAPLWQTLHLTDGPRPGLSAWREPDLDFAPSLVSIELQLASSSQRWNVGLLLKPEIIDRVSSLPPSAVSAVSVAERLKEVMIDLIVAFRPITISALELNQLSAGDVICLNHDTATPVIGYVERRPMLRLHMGAAGRHLAAEVLDAAAASK